MCRSLSSGCSLPQSPSFTRSSPASFVLPASPGGRRWRFNLSMSCELEKDTEIDSLILATQFSCPPICRLATLARGADSEPFLARPPGRAVVTQASRDPRQPQDAWCYGFLWGGGWETGRRYATTTARVAAGVQAAAAVSASAGRRAPAAGGSAASVPRWCEGGELLFFAVGSQCHQMVRA